MHKDGQSPVPRPDAAKGAPPAAAPPAPPGAADETARQTGEFPPVKGLDPAPAVARMANNISLYMTSLDMFCQGIPQYVAKMETALRAGDRASLHRLAHTIKGLAATIGAPGIASSAAHCERTIKEEGSVLDETELRSLSGALERLGADLAASGMLDGVDVSFEEASDTLKTAAPR